MQNILWSFSTTIRNPERIPSFFKTILEMKGEEWNNENQKRFQTLLIKNRVYVPEDKGLPQNLACILNDLNHEMTYEEAKQIFDAKGYEDAAMRGRTSFDPLEKVGLVYLINKKITISEVGKLYAEGKIEFGDVFFNALIKQQYPNPLLKRNTVGYNVKPFIVLLHLINEVNNKWSKLNQRAVGISVEEFGIFCLNIKHYKDVPIIADKIIDFRTQLKRCNNDREKRAFIAEYTNNYLSEFPSLGTKLRDYRDNMLRCIRLTKLIYIRGEGHYIDLEPRRKVEIDSLLKTDLGAAKDFKEDDWKTYIGSPTSYELPWEKIDSLIEIQQSIIDEIKVLRNELGLNPVEYIVCQNKTDADENILKLREERNFLLSKKTGIMAREFDNARNIASSYEIRTISRSQVNRPSVELERLSTLALNVIDDAITIRPNYPVGDDNEPTFTAPGGVPDIECFYENFNMACEVTMLSTRDQWINEGQPVMRHLRDFEDRSDKKDNYCLFIAPTIHIDTLNTFWFATKYEYNGKKQKILPLTIPQIHSLLEKVVELLSKGLKVKNSQLKQLFEKCTNVESISSSEEWRNQINNNFESWLNSL